MPNVSGAFHRAPQRRFPLPYHEFALMKIRTRLVALVALSLLPVLAFAGVMTVISWHQQRHAFEERYLERVRAMSIALDRRLEASIQLLQGLATANLLDDGDLRAFYARATRVAAVAPEWDTVALVDLSGHERLNLRRPFDEPLAVSVAGWEAFQRAVRTGAPAVSSLRPSPLRGVPSTLVFVPVVRDGTTRAVLYATLSATDWLRFLSLYPVAPDATMTLLDQDGIVIARTLNNDRWMGRPPAGELLAKARRTSDGAYRSIGLEGQQFYSAHSRSRVTGWTIATGVPTASVEAALWWSTLGVVLGVILSIFLAVALAIGLGARITQPVGALVDRAHALASGVPLPSPSPTQVEELDQVAYAFDEAARLLAIRQQERTASLAAERAARTEAEAARAEAEAGNRAKDEFLAMLGHELRNPLGAIGAAVYVLDQVRTDAQRVRGHEVIKRQVAHLTRLMNDLLDASRIATGKIVLTRQPLDLCEAVRRCMTAITATGQADGYQFVADLGSVWIDADETRIEQTVSNLLTNALKYTPTGGCITVSVRPDGDHAVLQITDTGAGIAPEMLPRIFDLFVQGERTLDRSQGGMGIGLTLARRLVELHAGRIEAASDGVGRGSTFTVQLPRIEAPMADARRATSVRHIAPRRILIVEDNDDVREMLRDALIAAGHQVTVATDGAAAVNDALRGRPDLAIVDIGLPVLDGYEVARQIRAGDGVPPLLIALTGYGRPEDRERALAAGFVRHLAKPIDPQQLFDVIAEAVANHGSPQTLA
jgi:signal transduction histidine kinase/ActR/RegA family two-component response regulator